MNDATGCPAQSRPWVLAATILGSSTAFIDGSVVSVALPAMQADLAAPVSEAQWIVNAYMLLLGALILIGGATGDRFGRRLIFVIGMLVFTGASVACGFAPNAAALIVARAVQGAGAALLVPTSLAIISAAFPEEERGRAIGTWAGASALTTALGPVLGGWLADAWSWRAIFFINVPVAALALAITVWRMPESHDRNSGPHLDWVGAVLAVVGLGALTYALTLASDVSWSNPKVIAALIIGIAVLAAFVWFEGRTRTPMMPLQLFRSADFSGANAITLLLYFALAGAFFFLPFNLIRVQGYPAALAGAAFLPLSLIMGVLSRWSGGLIERHGARRLLMIGPAIAAAGFALFAVPGIGGSYWTTFFLPMTLLGFGMAIAVAPLTTTVMHGAQERYAGVASGVNNATARVAGLLAVALLGSIAVGAFARSLEERMDRLQVTSEVRSALQAEAPKLAEAAAPQNVAPAERRALERALRESFVHSFRIVLLIAATLAALSAVVAWLTIDRKTR
ncbi:MAG TPA: DHA2 family efflux MFS transporter permease subunit [Steroidobacteraceae bacterium]|nr:DHA2 family efflux MFS transporter permease subunit [Steroidobacteraceae bacterium]